MVHSPPPRRGSALLTCLVALAVSVVVGVVAQPARAHRVEATPASQVGLYPSRSVPHFEVARSALMQLTWASGTSRDSGASTQVAARPRHQYHPALARAETAPQRIPVHDGASLVTSHQPPERVVALVPHQDDEVLAMGAALASLRRSGVEVHAVLVTDGSRPGVATVRAVNQRALREQAPPLTHRVSIYQARTREWQASLQALGVPASHHHVEGVGDGTVSQAAARGVIERWARRYPEAAMLTLSWLDVHPDHANLGRALDAWCLVHPWRSCAFAQFPRFVVGASHTLARPVASPAGAWVGEGPDLASVRAAAAEYKRWDPRRGRYAIGWTYSVPSQFEHVMRAPRTWLHGTSRRWRTLADLQRSQQWGRVLTRGGGAR